MYLSETPVTGEITQVTQHTRKLKHISYGRKILITIFQTRNKWKMLYNKGKEMKSQYIRTV